MADPKQYRRPSSLIIGIAIIILVAAVGLRVYRGLQDDSPPTVLAVLNSAAFDTEVADTPEERELGLGGRDSLKRTSAMFFPFSSARYWVFWMKDMNFPIDIIWVREGRVVDVAKNVPVPDGPILKRYSPSEPADAVFEVNAGIADEINVKPGDALRFKY